MRRLLIVNNVPTPYRTFLFNKINDLGVANDIALTVAFQAEQLEAHRWKLNEADMRFPYFFSAGLRLNRSKRVSRFSFSTFNPDILKEVRVGRYDWILTSALQSVGSWALALTPSAPMKLLWSESNLTSARYLRGPVRWFKGALEAPFSALVCPGQRAVEYARYLNPMLATRPILWLPNVVDTAIFTEAVGASRTRCSSIRERLGVRSDELLLLGAGQLVERKGFETLIEAIGLVAGPYRVILLGDGPRRGALTNRIRELGIENRVRLEPEVDQSGMPDYFAACDWFIHPALRDPSPLVVVEALNAGLPLAVSRQTGNSPEAVEEGANGFTFDGRDVGSVAAAVHRMVMMGGDERSILSGHSSTLARERFDPDTVVSRFLDALIELRAA